MLRAFAFLAAWTEFVSAFTLDSGRGLSRLRSGYTSSPGFIHRTSARFWATPIAASPTTVLLIAAQRWIRSGLRAGGLMG